MEVIHIYQIDAASLEGRNHGKIRHSTQTKQEKIYFNSHVKDPYRSICARMADTYSIGTYSIGNQPSL